ncbi:uncharacterized protein LOC119776201 isoform X1 [Cyprinodon tularosa]|uniref:uncharacterized protein LOC119776201 isoform X1 n=1 Tax=Cyprinodon tularosa TaxID=77115 RepID=UPI0018E26606|nr:uncharacterized protein LOC119776201 isoform X1 [Cyprinodon tularosa]
MNRKMRPAVIISCFLMNTIIQTGAAAVVKTQQTVSTAVGEDAPLSCQLLGTKGVQQVTWQKDFGNKERNICSYSEYFGQTVNPDFKDKVQFTEAGLKNSSIVIRNVTEQDEGYYFCLFNIYPDVALIGRTCLNVYELHEPILDVSRSKSPAESVVSCSATGRPAPTVTLTVLQQNLSFSHYNSSSVTHSNGTVTVTTTALLSASSSTQVGCSVSVLSAAPREKLITVPGVKGTSDDGLEKQSESSLRDSRWPLIFPFLMLMMVIIGIFLRRFQQSNDFNSPRCHMEQLCVIFLILNCGASQLKGAAVVVQTQLNVLAAEGVDAPLSCQLLETKGVLQVTWQRVFGSKERNICSYSEHFGQTVNPDFKDKVQFIEAGLKNSSIVIRKVTEKDEGCYLCLFNIYPDGALIGRTCLNVYELHEPILDVSRSESPAESVVSCSATGRPAPTVTLTVLQQNLSFSHYNSSSVTHSNGTVTVTTTALLSAFSSTQVGCSVSVLSAAPREKLIIVPGFKETSDDGLKEKSVDLDPREESVDQNFNWIYAVVVVTLACSCCLAIFTYWRYKTYKNRGPEQNKTPLRTTPKEGASAKVVKTPLLTLMNECRQRTSTKKSPENNRAKASPSYAPKRLFSDESDNLT